MAKGYCWGPNCNEEVEMQMCCSGRECGCMGLPVEPPFCSESCYEEYKNSRSTIIQTPLDLNIKDNLR